MTYAERRAEAMEMAAAHDGWDRPPTPDTGRLMEIEFKAREKRQDREKFG